MSATWLMALKHVFGLAATYYPKTEVHYKRYLKFLNFVQLCYQRLVLPAIFLTNDEVI
jgi:hypothetical protein